MTKQIVVLKIDKETKQFQEIDKDCRRQKIFKKQVVDRPVLEKLISEVKFPKEKYISISLALRVERKNKHPE